jgi:putative PIN family toxin of toxin-antitoxin system
VRAVVDTNVWVSAVLNEAGLPTRILDAYLAGRFTLVVSEPMLVEMAEVLARPRLARRHGRPPERIATLVATLREKAALVPVSGTVQVCRDPDDNVVIETAMGGRADLLVSGDQDLTHAQEVAEHLAGVGIRVITVRRFLEELDSQPQGSMP